MMKKKTGTFERLRSSVLFKVLDTVALCVLLWCICLGAYALMTSGRDTTLSSAYGDELARDGQNLFLSERNSETFDEEELVLRAKNAYSKDSSNARIKITRHDADGEELLVDTFGGEELLLEKNQVFGLDGEGNLSLERVSSEEEAGKALEVDNLSSVYLVHLGLVKELRVHDAFWNIRLWNKILAPVLTAPVLFLALSLTLFSLMLVLALISAGHQKGREGIALYGTDQVPVEIAVLLLFFAELVLAILLGRASSLPGQVIERFGAAFLIFLVMCLLFFVFLLSLTRRIKAGRLAATSLLVKLWQFLSSSGKRLPYHVVTAFLCVVFLLSNFHLLPGAVLLILFAVLLYHLFQEAVLERQIDALEKGDLSAEIPEKTLRFMAGNEKISAFRLNNLAEGTKKAVERSTKAERLRYELITNVSHDIRTPLTSIISYVDLLGKEGDETKKQEYLEVLARQAERLKNLTEDVLESSKAGSGSMEVNLAKVDVKEILDQSVAEYEDRLQKADLTVLVNADDCPAVCADGRLLWRVLRNLLSNAAKYSMPGTRVYLDAAESDHGMVRITVRNISRDPLHVPADELMERFVRGDAARHTEGSGLGLDIASSLTKLMHGTFQITIDGDLFRADICLPVAEDTPAKDCG